jgi:hypothetical protein
MGSDFSSLLIDNNYDYFSSNVRPPHIAKAILASLPLGSMSP